MNSSNINDLNKEKKSSFSIKEESAQRARVLKESLKTANKNKRFPLQREAVLPKPFPFESLGPVLGPVAKRIHEVVKSPDSICGQSVLSAAALVVQAYANIYIDGRIYPLSLFTLTVAESGDRKSAVDSIVLKPVRDYEKMLKVSFDEEKRRYKNKLDVWKKQREQILRGGSDRLEADLNKMDSEPAAPLEPYLLLEEPTYEGLVKLYAVGQPSMGLFSDEGGRMLGGHGMGKDNLLKTACGLSSLWDGKPITRIRGGDENLLLYGKRLSMHLMIQEVVFKTVLQNELLLGQGLIARCLIVAPTSNAGERPYNPIDISQDSVVVEFYQRVSTILDQPFPIANSGPENELAPRSLMLTASAKKRWEEFHNEVDKALRLDGAYHVVRRSANKAAEQVLRMAGLLTLVENFDAPHISLDAVEKAIDLMRFYLDEALRITDVSFSDPDLDLAQAVLNWMKKNASQQGKEKVFSLSEIYQRGGPRGVRNKKAAERVMFILEEHQEVQRVSQGNPVWRLRSEC